MRKRKEHRKTFTRDPVIIEQESVSHFMEGRDRVEKEQSVGVVRLMGMSDSPPSNIPGATNGSVWLVLSSGKVKPYRYRKGKRYEEEAHTQQATQSS